MSDDYTKIPENLKPISPWAYFGLSILYSVPIVGIIFLIIHSLSRSNINKRNYARSYFCILALVLIIVGIILIVSAATTGVAALGDKLRNLFAK